MVVQVWRQGLYTMILVTAGISLLGCQTMETESDQAAATGQSAVEPAPAPSQSPEEVAAEQQVTEPEEAVTPQPEIVKPEEQTDSEHAVVPEQESIVDQDELHRQVMEACDSAAEFWDEGNLDDAIAALDRAYELLLLMDGDDDPSSLDLKDSLRILIADRLVSLYRSQQTAASEPKINWDLEIPLVDNSEVQAEIKSFQQAERASFLAAYQRSGRYRPMILAKLEAAGLPSQLSWLPMIESEFKIRALSRASALGLWQFIRSTGNRFGLKRDAWVDERMDPEKSTDAAIAYLTELHALFGDWPKAMAGYNCGEHRVLRLDRRTPDQDLDFWDFYQLLPRETRRYIPRFFATLLILGDPDKYGFELPEVDASQPPNAEVQTSKSYQLSSIDKLLNLPEGALASLNPELRLKATPKRPYLLKVPAAHQQLVSSSIATLPEWTPPQPQYTTYRVRRGDTLSKIARRFGTSSSAIARINGIRNRHRIGAGALLKVPIGGNQSSTFSSSRIAPVPIEPGKSVTYTVRRGDTLYHIAKAYRTTVGRLKTDNSLTSSRLYPGQQLVVSAGTRNGSRTWIVRPGDTPIAIARAHNVSLTMLLRVNGLTSRSTIYPGQTLVIPD